MKKSGLLDLILNFPGYHRVKFNDVMRNLLKIIMSVAWCIILPLFYVNSSTNVNLPFDLTKYLRQIKGVPQLYLFAVALYLLPNILAAALFVFPMFRRWIENSDFILIRFLLWWSQVKAIICC